MGDYDIVVKQLQLVMQAIQGSKHKFGLAYQFPVKTMNNSRLWDTLALQLNELIDYVELDTNRYITRRELAHIEHMIEYHKPLKHSMSVNTTCFSQILANPTSDTFHVTFVAGAQVTEFQIPHILFMAHRLFEKYVEVHEMDKDRELRMTLVLPSVVNMNDHYVRRLINGPEDCQDS
jgi:hypothetical protein